MAHQPTCTLPAPSPSSPVSVHSTQALFTHTTPLPAPSRSASLFRAVHAPTGRDVAIKTYLKRDLLRAGGAAGRRVAVEREALARAAGRGAPPLLAATHDACAVALVMGFVGGAAPTPGRRVAEVLRGVVRALQALHARRVLHLDVKAENVVVGDGGVTLVDFGSAALEDMVEEGRDYASSCTVDVVPPELLEGAVPSRAADVWGVGVLACALAGGGAAFRRRGDGDYAVMDRVLRYAAGGDVAVGEVTGGLSGVAEDFVRACLHPRPDKRLGVREPGGAAAPLTVDYDALCAHPFLAE